MAKDTLPPPKNFSSTDGIVKKKKFLKLLLRGNRLKRVSKERLQELIGELDEKEKAALMERKDKEK